MSEAGICLQFNFSAVHGFDILSYSVIFLSRVQIMSVVNASKCISWSLYYHHMHCLLSFSAVHGLSITCYSIHFPSRVYIICWECFIMYHSLILGSLVLCYFSIIPHLLVLISQIIQLLSL